VTEFYGRYFYSKSFEQNKKERERERDTIVIWEQAVRSIQM